MHEQKSISVDASEDIASPDLINLPLERLCWDYIVLKATGKSIVSPSSSTYIYLTWHTCIPVQIDLSIYKTLLHLSQGVHVCQCFHIILSQPTAYQLLFSDTKALMNAHLHYYHSVNVYLQDV